MASGAPHRAAKVGATLGEGPVWVAREKALWFVDIKQHKLHRFDPVTRRLRSWDAPAQVGWIVPAKDGAFVVGLQRGLARFNPADASFLPLGAVEPALPGNRLNDATVDRDGRIWFGTMDDGEAGPTGRFYVADGVRTRDTGLPPVSITNGPAISPDGRILYHTDTLGRAIFAADIRDDATVGPPRVFARIEDGAGYPDGPTVDSAGHVWTGLYAGWAARRYAPDGKLVETVRLPVANVTKIAFGGEGLTTVYVTTARQGLDAAALAAQPEAGDLFAFETDTPGLAGYEAVLAR